MPTESARLARLGAAIASESRAAILCSLMDGTAHTNGELARHVGLAPSSVSEHVAVLVDAGLVVTEAQGRHRYVRIADGRVADLVEHLGALAAEHRPVPAPSVPSALGYARSCYHHLAGTLGVAICDHLVDRAVVISDPTRDAWCMTADGPALLDEIASSAAAGRRPVDPDGTASRRYRAPRPCLDWSERRAHLAGSFADDLLAALLAARWLRRHPHRPRALVVTDLGRRAFPTTLGIELP